MAWRTVFPFLVWGKEYGRDPLARDLVAALIVTIMLVPQSLAYAMLAGLPAHVGLYASILPLIAYAAFGSSRTLAVGPVAVVSLMTAAAAGAIAPPGSEAYGEAALALALLSGVILAAMAVLRLGVMANFLSHPVISGFISASGLLIAVSQARHLLGIEARGDTLTELLPQLAAGIGKSNPPTIFIGLAAIVFLFWVRGRLRPLLLRIGLPPRLAETIAKAGPVIAVLASIFAVRQLDLAAKGVRVVGAIPAGLPPLTFPSFDPGLWLELLPAALLISLVGFVESVSVAQTLAARRRQRIDANQELVGLGAANLAASLSGGFPVTGGFARSVVNFDAGAATPLAGAFTAVAIALATLLLAPLFADLPQAVLAATIVVAVLSLVDIPAMRRVFAYSRSDFAAMATTILLVLLGGIEIGILGGVALSLLLYLWRTSRPHMAVVGQVPGSEHFRNVERHQVIVSPTVLSLRVDESLYFANARYLEDRIYDLVAARPGIRHVVLMCPAVNFIDASALESLEAIVHRLQAAGVDFHLSEVKGPVMDRLARSDFLQHLTGRVFLSQHQAMRELDPATLAAAAATPQVPPRAG